MKSKSILLALGTSLSLGLVNVASADANNPFQAEKLQTGYSNTDGNFKLAKGKCGSGKCGSNAETDKNDKKANGKCGSGKCGATKDKKGSGKCGSGKCGSKS
ncbi:hypothetical protein [Legionella genomosp. 1]|uniref:HvfA family oxazolone/thioamide-modified RiPP metallophore n=1 Tax=Legionella genomosp. 1 TaxID=1093625 RepID=UPI001C9E7FA1|nr:hypothetical protein [Legionella genomosp. 1]